MKIELEVEKRIVGKLERDDYYESPDAWGDTSVFLVFEHRDFQVDRNGFKPRDIYDFITYPDKPLREDCKEGEGEDYEDRLQYWEENKGWDYSEYYIFNLNAYIHSGVVLSLGRNYLFNDRWDTSSTGFVLVKKEEADDEDKAKKLAEGLVSTWNTYLSGDIWSMSVELQTVNVVNDMVIDSEDLDSCGGYYGIELAEEELMFIIEHYQKDYPEAIVKIIKQD